MVALILLALNLMVAVFKSKSRLEAENAALRQQLIVLRRKLRGRAALTSSDRLFLRTVFILVPVDPEGHNDRLSRHARALASCRVSTLLALEVSLTGGSPSDRCGAAGIDPPYEHGEPCVY